MKKLLLVGSALVLALGNINAQTPGITTTSAYDDFQTTTPYTGANGSGIYWYSGAASAPNGTRTVGKMTLEYPTATAYSYIAADFGNDNGTPKNIDLTSMADIEIDLKNVSTKDLQLRVYLKDVNGKYLELEPNISDAEAVDNFSTPTTGIQWNANNLVYPQPVNYPADPAVYPTVAYNGFVLQAGQRKTYRIDLSSVAASKGGRKYTQYDGTEPSDSPASITSTAEGFDITNVHVVEFVFNENTAFNLTDNAMDQGSYRFDAKGIAQNDYSGTIEFYSFKVGSVLSALPPAPNGVNEEMISSSLKLYPNPAAESVTVSFSSAEEVDVTLTDIIGNPITASTATVGENQVKLNTTGLSTGMYIVKIATKNGVVARKVSIK